jgi:integrase
VSNSRATAYAFRHHYAVSNINNWIGTGFGFDDKFLYLSKSMGHYDIESTKYYYSLVPGLADILEEMTNEGFEDIVPEVDYEESQ